MRGRAGIEREFKFGFIGSIRNSEFGIRNYAGKKKNQAIFLPRFQIILFGDMIFATKRSSEKRFRSPVLHNSEFRIPNSELDR